MSSSLFVTPQWLAAHLADQDIQLLDARLAPRGRAPIPPSVPSRCASPAPCALISMRCPTTLARCPT